MINTYFPVYRRDGPGFVDIMKGAPAVDISSQMSRFQTRSNTHKSPNTVTYFESFISKPVIY
jgi:hypothetical protein